jgi:hypothetical protein
MAQVASALPPTPEDTVAPPTTCPATGCDPSQCAKAECGVNTTSAVKSGEDKTPTFGSAPPGQINLLDIEVDSANTALNVMVGFLGLAQKRGVFAINESAKIFECINKFS